ncbi:hypothetical protein FK521_30240, partial [Klebsiella pneumoniae]|nr:hypothetical protein [Klebsiella pneumoniae]
MRPSILPSWALLTHFHAKYGETRASLFPTVDAELSHTRSKTVASGLSSASQADGGGRTVFPAPLSVS